MTFHLLPHLPAALVVARRDDGRTLVAVCGGLSRTRALDLSAMLLRRGERAQLRRFLSQT